MRRYIFLFDKVMLMCKTRIVESFLWGEMYNYKHALVLNNYTLDPGNNGPITRVLTKPSFTLGEKEHKTAITFYCKTEDDKRRWIDSIKMAMENFSPPHAKENGFDFMMKTFPTAEECDSCGKFLSGCFYQGYFCHITKKKAHKQCIEKLVNRRQRPIRTISSMRRLKCKASKAYTGTPAPPNGAPLRLAEGDVIDVINSENPSWWLGCKLNIQGYFPSSYVKAIRQPSNGSMHPPSPGPNRTHSSRHSSLSHSLSHPSQGHQELTDYENTPDLNLFPWYVGMSDKTDASLKLNNQEDGVFLVRESKQRPGEYALGISYRNAVKHIKIQKNSLDCKWHISDSRSFATIQDLVRYYQINSLQDSFNELPTTLKIPYKEVNNHRGLSRLYSSSSSISNSSFEASTEFRRPFPRSRTGSTQSINSTPMALARRSLPPNIISRATVQFDYSPKEPNQITLRCGETVVISSKAGGDKGWWKGAVLRHGQVDKFGYFPLAYVVEIDDDADMH